MSSTLENKILNLQERLRAETESRDRDRRVNSDVPPGSGIQPSSSAPTSSSVVRRPRQRIYYLYTLLLFLFPHTYPHITSISTSISIYTSIYIIYFILIYLLILYTVIVDKYFD